MAQATRRPLEWVNITAMAILHGLALYALYVVSHFVVDLLPLADTIKLIVLFVGLTTVTGFGITVGYHRLFTHTGFRCGLPLRLILLVAGGLAVEGSADAWVRDHRQHHRKADVTRTTVVAAGLDPSRVG